MLEGILTRVLRSVFGGGADISAANPLQVFDPEVFGSIGGLVLSGRVTAAVPGVSFTIDSLKGLGAGKFQDATAPYRAFVLRTALGTSLAPQGEMAAITGYTTASGLFTPNGPPAFTVDIAVNDEVLILHPRIAEIFDVLTRTGTNTDPAGTTTVFARLRQIVDTYLASGTVGLAAIKAVVDAILVDTNTTLEGKLDIIAGYLDTEIAAILAAVDTEVAAIKAQTDKLAGATPTVGTTTANWNTATGGSGETGEDLVTIGADGVKNKILSLILDISALTNASVVTVKMFMEVNGTERKVYSEGFVRQTQTNGSEPDGLWIISGAVGIHEALRVEVYSSTSESVAIGYDYMLEVM